MTERVHTLEFMPFRPCGQTIRFAAPQHRRIFRKRGGLLRFRARRAVAALEFALTAPILLLMMIGLICFGFYFVFMHELQELASSAARASVAGLSDAERDTLARQFVATAIADSAMLNAADVTVSTSSAGTPATLYEVTVDYTLKDTPIPMLAGLISLQLSDISRTSTVKFGTQ
jgi:Flp pilus assembly protein TadG